MIASFFVEHEEEKFCFFEETFLLADISINVALVISSFILSNIEVDFTSCYLY